MTTANIEDGEVKMTLSKAEALVLFEWLSRKWKMGKLSGDKLFLDPAENKILMDLEADLSRILSEPFDPNYNELLAKAYRIVLPDLEDWV